MTYAIIEATRHVLVAAIPIILIKTGNLFNHTTGEKNIPGKLLLSYSCYRLFIYTFRSRLIRLSGSWRLSRYLDVTNKPPLLSV